MSDFKLKPHQQLYEDFVQASVPAEFLSWDRTRFFFKDYFETLTIQQHSSQVLAALRDIAAGGNGRGAAAAANFTRNTMRQDGLLRRILPAIPLVNGDGNVEPVNQGALGTRHTAGISSVQIQVPPDAVVEFYDRPPSEEEFEIGAAVAIDSEGNLRRAQPGDRIMGNVMGTTSTAVQVHVRQGFAMPAPPTVVLPPIGDDARYAPAPRVELEHFDVATEVLVEQHESLEDRDLLHQLDAVFDSTFEPIWTNNRNQ